MKNYQIIDSVELVHGEYTTLAAAEKQIRKLGRKVPHGVYSIREEDPDNWALLCKRTNYPKLGYIIHRLKSEKIACRFNGESWHADYRLEVEASREADAWKILRERHGRYRLDDVRDDHPKFLPYEEQKP
jgi:hypothetical protein